MRVLLFGTGAYYEQYKLFFSHVTVVALLDNDEKKQGTRIDGIPVLPPQAALRETYDGIYLLSIYAAEMRRQLENIGVPPEKIFDRDEIYDTLAEHLPARQVIEVLPEGSAPFFLQDKVLGVLAQDMEFNGATIALCQAVNILQKDYSHVVVISMQDGPMREKFLRAGVPVFVDPWLRIVSLDEIPWIKKCRMLLVNTNLFYGIFRRGSGRVPILWWLHDPEMLYQGKFCEKVDGFYSDNIKVYAVGTLAAEAFQRRCPHWPVRGLLCFGMEDFGRERKERHSAKVVFAVVGSICYIKGQDIFVEAIQLLPTNLRQQCEFWLVGAREESAFALAVADKAATMSEVKFLGLLKRAEIEGLYSQIDVLICPSREESMSAVSIEAMMNFCPSIVSDHAGVVAFIRNGDNGLVFPSGDAAALAEKMKWAAEHPKERQTMGEKARVIYEENFSLSAFEKNLCIAVDEVLGQSDETCHVERR